MNESTLAPREEISDLDWLARNVHVWPSVTPKIYPAGCKEFINGAVFHDEYMILDADIEITKDQWLSRRAELQNKPSWGSHEFAVIAQGGNGYWYGSNVSEEKFGHEESFCITGTGWNYICDGIDLGDWRDTLEKRPEQTIADICREVTGENRHEEIFEPFVSVEDENPRFPRDVDYVGKINAATAKQQDPVNSPSHYASGGIECIEAIKASMSHEAFLGYLKGNVQKYTWRYEKKVNPTEDLRKAQWYLSKLIDEQFS